jgi:hypothetical protein
MMIIERKSMINEGRVSMDFLTGFILVNTKDILRRMSISLFRVSLIISISSIARVLYMEVTSGMP